MKLRLYACCIENWLLKIFKTYAKYIEFTLFSPYSTDIKGIIFSVNTLGTFGQVASFLDNLWWLTSRGELKKLVFLSNYGIYKPSLKPLKEDSEKDPMNLSGVKALIVEDFLKFLSHEFPVHVHILRLFNVYGPYQEKGYIVADIIDEVVSGNIIKAGDMKKVRDFLYVEDFIEVVRKIIESSEKFSVYNVASGEEISIKNLIETAVKVSGKPSVKILFDPTRIRDEYDYDYVVADISKIKKELDWKPKISLEEGLKLTYQWYLGSK